MEWITSISKDFITFNWIPRMLHKQKWFYYAMKSNNYSEFSYSCHDIVFCYLHFIEILRITYIWVRLLRFHSSNISDFFAKLKKILIDKLFPKMQTANVENSISAKLHCSFSFNILDFWDIPLWSEQERSRTMHEIRWRLRWELQHEL